MVLILTRSSVLEYLGEATVASIRTGRGIPSEVSLGADDGSPGSCAVNPDHVQTVARGGVGALIATLGARRTGEVREALLFALGF